MIRNRTAAARQGGVALVTSLLLLVIITILAVSMFRSFGTQEKIAGNVREKARALHAAGSAQQYAEWWLLQGGNTATGAVACAAGVLNATATIGQICNQTLLQQYNVTTIDQVGFPWPIRVTYAPQNMLLASLGQTSPNDNTNPVYFDTPAFYITDLGVAADAAGEAYQIDAYGYGSAASTVAIVESTYEVQQGVVNRGGL